MLCPPKEKEQHVFCSVRVMVILRAIPRTFESVPSNFNSYVKVFQRKAAISMKGISFQMYSVMSMLHTITAKTLCQILTCELITKFFFIAVLSERTPETPQTVLIPRFELPLSTLGKNYCTLQLIFALEMLSMSERSP